MVGAKNSLFYSKARDRFQYALDCLNNHNCYNNITEYNNINVFEELSSMQLGYKNHEKNPITRELLEIAKQLLKTHIDFIIMENYTDYSTAVAIASLLNAYQDHIVKLTKEFHHGTSKWSPEPYRTLMPPSILKHLETENELDLELYHYAIQLFQERAEIENWNGIKH